MTAPLYLSGEAIRSLRVPPRQLRDALAEAFRLRAADEPHVEPKHAITIAPGRFFQSMAAASPCLGYAVLKWVGVSAANAAHGLPTVQATVILNDIATGVPAAILDGEALTILRTAALSALAAEFLARPDSRSIGFVGCGAQAAGHLDAFRDLLPGLTEAVCFSAGTPSAMRLAAMAEAGGLAARVTTDPGDTLGCDIVVTSVRHGPDLRPFLDSGLVRPGAFVTAVDLGASWRPDALSAFDDCATDDRRIAEEPATRARLAWPGLFRTDLAGLASGRDPGRASPEARTLFLFAGNALADLAAAAVITGVARAAGTGLVLPA